jgi:S-adenosylmethionine synthetase
MARYVAKNVVAADLCERCEVQVSYAIGYPEPISIMIDTHGTGKVPEDKIEQAVKKVFSFKPAEIIRVLDLKKPVYQKTASYGHFGRTEFTWERPTRSPTPRRASFC